MAVNATPQKPTARKRKKSGALPDGLAQFTLDELAPETASSESETESPASEPEAHPVNEQPEQLGFDSLVEQEPEAGHRKPPVFGDVGAASRSAPGRRKGKKKAELPEGVYQSSL